MNMLPSEDTAIVGVVAPGHKSAATYTSAYGDASQFEEFMALVAVGTIGTGANVAAQLLQATDSSGTGAKAIGSHQITAITTSSKEALINLRREELDVANGFRFVALQMVVAVAATDCAGVLIGFDPSNGKGSLENIAGVTQID